MNEIENSDDGNAVDITPEPQLKLQLDHGVKPRVRSRLLAAIPPPIPKDIESIAREAELTKLRRGLAAKRTNDAVPAGYEAIRTAAASGVFDLRLLAARLLEGQTRADSGHFMTLPHRPVAEQVLPVEAPPQRSVWMTIGLASVGLLTAVALVLTGVALALYFQPAVAPQSSAAPPPRAAIQPPVTATVTATSPPPSMAVAAPAVAPPPPELELKPVTVLTRPTRTPLATMATLAPPRQRPAAAPGAPKTPPVTMAPQSHKSSVAALLAAARKRAARQNGTLDDKANRPTHLSRARMARSLNRLHGPAKLCFKRGNIVAARTSVRLRIQGSTGRVAHAQVIGKWANSVPGRCLRRAALSLRFGQFTGTTQTVLYPIIIR